MKRKRVTAKLIIAPNPILTQVCEPVADGEDVSGIIRDMMHILTNSKHGVGLAAPQAGHLRRIIIFKHPEKGFMPIINPVIGEYFGKDVTEVEGCLSYPGVHKRVKRSMGIIIDGDMEDGTKETGNIITTFSARIIQHEIDHLDGKCKVGE